MTTKAKTKTKTILVVALAAPAWAGSAQAADCPTEAEVKASIEHSITTDIWTPTERSIWQVKTVDGFAFGPMKFGKLSEKAVDTTFVPKKVCPVRFEYSYKVTRNSGKVDNEQRGAGQTHYFYPNEFDEWTYVTER